MSVISFIQKSKKLYGYQLIESAVGPLLLMASSNGLVSVTPEINISKSETKSILASEEQQKIRDILKQTESELNNYFDQNLTEFSVPLDLNGTDFQRQVWHELINIPYANHSNYSAIAQLIGRPKACRAVGAAIGANPLLVIVPCHRVLGKNGSLTGFAHGLTMKRQLLELEQQANKANCLSQVLP